MYTADAVSAVDRYTVVVLLLPAEASWETRRSTSSGALASGSREAPHRHLLRNVRTPSSPLCAKGVLAIDRRAVQ